MKIYSRFLLFVLVSLLIYSCKKDDDEQAAPVHMGLNIEVLHKIDGKTLEFDTLLYQNEAGNNYGVTKLQYYLSRFEFTSITGAIINYDTICYIDGTNSNNIYFPSLPSGFYTKMNFLVGLDSIQNLTDFLPNTIENANMAWPVGMGGGYHFMKLEGFFTNMQTYGYAMHLGKNINVVPVSINTPFNIASDKHHLHLEMNINEWYRNPHVYDFNTDGNYSMADSAAMTKLNANGRDVFSIKQ